MTYRCLRPRASPTASPCSRAIADTSLSSATFTITWPSITCSAAWDRAAELPVTSGLSGAVSAHAARNAREAAAAAMSGVRVIRLLLSEKGGEELCRSSLRRDDHRCYIAVPRCNGWTYVYGR